MPFRAPARRESGVEASPYAVDEGFTHDPRGQSLVELAIVLPILALFLVIAIDFGRVFFTYVQISNAAREAAALGAADPNGPIDNDAMRDRALEEANTQDAGGAGNLTLVAQCRDAGGAAIPCAGSTAGSGAGNTVTVTVKQEFGFITPLVNGMFDDYEMEASATAAILGYASGQGVAGPGAPNCTPPVASFTIISSGGLDIEVDPSASTPQSVGDPCNISGYFWYWGDGTDEPGNATAASYTYANPGTYTVTLEVTNQAGTGTATAQAVVPESGTPSCDPPVADFTTSTSGNGANRLFTYQDTSTVSDEDNCPITAWLWTFHDNGPTTSNAQFPAPFQYQSAGNKRVTLEVTNAGGSDSVTRGTP